MGDPATYRVWAGDRGPLGGVEFCHRDIFGSGVSLDVSGLYGLEGQQSFALSVGSPQIAKSRFLLVLRGRFLVEVGRPFFGLGMNEVGSQPSSRHDIQDAAGVDHGRLARFENIAFNFTLGVRNVQLWCPSGDESVPCTTSEFPDLPGIDGGWVNYLGLSVVWDNSDSIVRPTRGRRFIVKAIHTNNLLVGVDCGGGTDPGISAERSQHRSCDRGNYGRFFGDNDPRCGAGPTPSTTTSSIPMPSASTITSIATSAPGAPAISTAPSASPTPTTAAITSTATASPLAAVTTPAASFSTTPIFPRLGFVYFEGPTAVLLTVEP